MNLYYSDYIDYEFISKTAADNNFTTPLNLEKFIMDFELQYQISQRLNCVLRGGMCVPFHIGAKRLSVDIDLITDQTKDDIVNVMDSIGSDFSELIIKPIKPKDPLPVKNLISYGVEFKSCLGQTTGIKIDFASDMELTFPIVSSQKTNIFSVSIDHEIALLSKGALIGDKISSLALNSIGYPQNSGHVPKQIFDVSGLLNSIDDTAITDTLNSFENITNQKLENCTLKSVPTTDEIITDIDNSLSTLLTPDYSLTKTHNSIYGNFTSTLLGDSTSNYPKSQHIEDILLTKMFSKLIQTDSSNITEKVELIKNTFNGFGLIKRTDVAEASSERKKLLNSLTSDTNLNKRVLRNIPLPHLFLTVKNEILEKEN